MDIEEIDIMDAEKIIDNLNTEYGINIENKVRPKIIRKFKSKYVHDNFEINLKIPKDISERINKCNTYIEVKNILDYFFNDDVKGFKIQQCLSHKYMMPSRYLTSQHMVDIRQNYTYGEASKILDEKMTDSIWIMHGLIDKGYTNLKREYIKDILYNMYLILDKNISFALNTEDLMTLESMEKAINNSQDVFTFEMDKFDVKITFKDQNDADKFIGVYKKWFRDLYYKE